MEIELGDLSSKPVIELLEAHLTEMYATSPPESIHALDVSKLKDPKITFWICRRNDELLGCIAIKELDDRHGEIKSMRTSAKARKQGIASSLLSHLIDVARERGYHRLSLETGAMDFFKPARTLYEKFGFQYGDPFGDYVPDPNSKFMTRTL